MKLSEKIDQERNEKNQKKLYSYEKKVLDGTAELIKLEMKNFIESKLLDILDNQKINYNDLDYDFILDELIKEVQK